MKLNLLWTSALGGLFFSNAFAAASESSLTGNKMTDIVLGYIAGCAGVSLNPESCIAKEAVKISLQEVKRTLSPSASRLLFGNYENTDLQKNLEPFAYKHHEDGACDVSFDFDVSMVRDIVDAAELHCILNGQAEGQQEKYNAIDAAIGLLGAKKCWESLCSQETAVALLATYFDTCADIKLPYPLPSVDEMAQEPEVYEPDVKLSCMLDFAMSSEATAFGLESPTPGSTDSCYPPGYKDIKNVCPSKIGPVALQACLHATLIKPTRRERYSYSYSSSMTFFQRQKRLSSHSYEYDDYYDYSDPEDDKQYIANLCNVLDQLSSDKGKQCLNPLCGIEGSHDGALVPTQPPTRLKTVAPSQRPSNKRPAGHDTTVQDNKATSGANRTILGKLQLATLCCVCWLVSVLLG